MKTENLIDLTKEEYHSPSISLSRPGKVIVNDRDNVLNDLKRDLNKALLMKVDRKFYLSSIDPGIGKTTLLAEVVQRWLSRSIKRDVGVLLCFATKAEIEAFITISGLDEAQYAVQTSDRLLNGKGLGFDRADEAMVLLTTHEMIRHNAGENFEKAKQFHYKGAPRYLRVWDEGMALAEAISIRLDDISSLYSQLRLHHEKLAEALERCIPSSATACVGDKLMIPAGLIFPNKKAAEAMFGVNDTRIGILANLACLRGRELEIGEDRTRGKTLMGHSRELPADLAPIFILDGSGRLKESYRLYEAHRTDWHRLPAYQHDYCNLTINWWKRASGKTALADPAKRIEIVEAAAAKINKDDDEWLVIIPKDDVRRGYNLEQLIKDEVTGGKRRVQFIHWGIHKATNDYRHIKHVMVIGLLLYPESAYKAAYSAYTGLSAGTAPDDDIGAVRRSEIQDHLLQGVMRSNIRNPGPDGKCGDGEVFIVAPAMAMNEVILEEAFPGCSIVPWEPIPKGLTKQAVQVVDEIIKQLSGGLSFVTKKAVRDALGLDAPALSRHLRRPMVKKRLIEEGIKCRRNEFVRK